VTGIGPDANKPPCKKAKLIRLERKHKKLLNRGLTHEAADVVLKQRKSQQQEGKSLEDLLNEPLPANPAHRLEVVDYKLDSEPEGVYKPADCMILF
jgi:hypothetical protein